MELKSCYKKDGKFFDKVREPNDTVKWAKERFEALGDKVFEEAVRIDKGRLDIPVYISKYTPEAIRMTGTPKQMGKGATPEQAEASAVMELAERYSLFHFKHAAPKRLATMDELEGNKVPLDELFLSLHVVPKTREERSAIENALRSLPMEWVKAYSLVDKSSFWLPWNWFWTINEFNGSAAGNSIEEATVQALCELVERHVCSLVTYERAKTPTIDPGSFTHPMAKELIEKFKRVGVNLVLKDFTMGMGVPSVGAIAWDPTTFPHRSEIVYAAGTAPDPERAAIRAITEVAQLAGDFDTDGKYVESGLPKFSTLEEAQYVLDGDSVVSIHQLPNLGDDDFRKEVESIASTLEAKGLRSYIVDIRHPELQVPAVYAVIPGNHFRDRTINGDMVFHMAKLAVQLEDKEVARAFLDDLDQQFPSRYYIAFYRAYCQENLGNREAAVDLYREALRRGPDPVEVASIHCHLGACYREMGDYDAAILELNEAKKINPGLKEVYNLLGNCYYKLGRYVEAVQEFEQAISIDPSSAIDYANIGANLRMLGLKEAAIKWYEMALALDPALEWASCHLRELEEESKGIKCES